MIDILVYFVALLHILFLILEMFLWDTPTGRKIFATDADFAKKSRVLAANQGFYNGILAAGLIWATISAQVSVQIFFLIAVIAAGVFGAITVNLKILWLQAIPAVLALAAIYFTGSV